MRAVQQAGEAELAEQQVTDSPGLSAQEASAPSVAFRSISPWDYEGLCSVSLTKDVSGKRQHFYFPISHLYFSVNQSVAVSFPESLLGELWPTGVMV